MFFDEAKIYVKAGDGGNGVVAFRREAHVPRGGPSGGNGGRGGDVFLVADLQINTLIAFSKQIHFRAPSGAQGRGKNQTGAGGEDLLIRVPVGTVAYEAETDLILADLIHPDQRVLVARSGRGGRGNWAFKSPTVQAPRIAENGEPGEDRWIRLELKLIADVGIVGVPNAGKSTLLSVVSAARPKIADYPFTTLEPNLGTVLIDNRDMVFADIPGLIEGAHTGTGLGHTFLRHVERTRLLIHLLNGISPDPVGDYMAINQELALFSPELAAKPQIVVLNKMDLPDVQAAWRGIATKLKSLGVAEPMAISAVSREGCGGVTPPHRRHPGGDAEGIPDQRRRNVARWGPSRAYGAVGVACLCEQELHHHARRGRRLAGAGRLHREDREDDAMGILRCRDALPAHHAGAGHHRRAAGQGHPGR